MWQPLFQSACRYIPEYNVYRVLHSMHASYTEVCDFVSYLKPKRIVPCVIPVGDRTLSDVKIRYVGFKLGTVALQSHIYIPMVTLNYKVTVTVRKVDVKYFITAILSLTVAKQVQFCNLHYRSFHK